MIEKNPSSSPRPTPEHLRQLSDGLDKLSQDSKKALLQAGRILENFKKDPLDADFLPTLKSIIKSWETKGQSPQFLLRVPLGVDPYEFYVKEVSNIRTELWNSLPGYAKEALVEARKKIEPNDREKISKFERAMIDLCRAYQKTPGVFSEKNVRAALGIPQK